MLKFSYSFIYTKPLHEAGCITSHFFTSVGADLIVEQKLNLKTFRLQQLLLILHEIKM